ncbi:signal peptidase I [Haloarcula taiwanensis]|uniref:Signal peptidase I n=1 Tax=Haloarcula taiwanensis TaxID=1932004 RepID=A0A2H4ZYF9_9EURY|nr:MULTISPECIES: signal peptidase I [Haloarcula]AUG47470.1 signal peptidase I [Haloarcula taiwanensis]RLM42573.1 signal peptidase I [Haloarcula sp. Atlit-47R]
MDRLKKWLETALESGVIIFLIAMVLGQILGQPVLLGFVTTGSMQPTLEPGDGFVAIPADLAGSVEEGDVVTFRAEEIQGGGLTTHRVVDNTDRGYITRGDNNPFTDQDSDEPPVTNAQIVAVAWQPGGEVVAVPGVGTLVNGVRNGLSWVQQRAASIFGVRSLLGTQGLAYLLLGVSVGAYVLDFVLSGNRDRGRRDSSRDTGTSVRLLIGIFAAAIVLSATATMVAPAGPQEFGVVSAEFDSPGPRVIEQGTTESTQYRLGNGGYVPVVTYFDPATDGIAVEPNETVIPARSTVNATLSLTAPPERGYYRKFVVEHRYLLILPQSTIRSLYLVHPWLPIITIDALLGGAFYVLGTVLVDTGRVRSRSRDSPSKIRRLLTRLR